jgi:hypothetical protein
VSCGLANTDLSPWGNLSSLIPWSRGKAVLVVRSLERTIDRPFEIRHRRQRMTGSITVTHTVGCWLPQASPVQAHAGLACGCFGCYWAAICST